MLSATAVRLEEKAREQRGVVRSLRRPRRSEHGHDQCVELWRAVLRQTLEDVVIDVEAIAARLAARPATASRKQTFAIEQELVRARHYLATAKAWIADDAPESETGSFRWTCAQIDRDPDAVRRTARGLGA